MHTAECVECHQQYVSEDGRWQPGQICLFGTLFACSMACAEAWAREHANEGYRPGQPGFDATEPAIASCDGSDADAPSPRR